MIRYAISAVSASDRRRIHWLEENVPVYQWVVRSIEWINRIKHTELTVTLRLGRDCHPEQAERVVNDPMGRRPVGKDAVAA
jgi:CHASE3 domain sensor protein